MTQVSCFALLYVASALLYGAHRQRGCTQLALVQSAPRARLCRALACVLVMLAFWLQCGLESGPAPFFVTLVGLMSMGTFITLLGPLRPRWVWWMAVLCALSVVPSLLLGGVL